MKSTTAEEVVRGRPPWLHTHTHRVGVLVAGEQHRGGTALPGFGGPLPVTSQPGGATTACFVLRAAPTASLAGGDVLLVGADSLGGDSVPGQKKAKKASTH